MEGFAEKIRTNYFMDGTYLILSLKFEFPLGVFSLNNLFH